MLQSLKAFGLKTNESKVYQALLHVGTSTAKRIIEQSGLHRQTVYDALDLLIEKGLVSYKIQGNRKHFKAKDPKHFLGYFNSKKKQLEEERQHFLDILPSLREMQSKGSDEQEATVYYGNKGIKSILDDILQEKKALLTIGASDITAKGFQYQLRFNLPAFHKEREKKRIPFKVLYSEDMKARGKQMDTLRFTQARLLPKAFTSNTSINIYGNKLAILLWGSNPFGVLIESREIAAGQRKHFHTLWSLARPTHSKS